MSPRPLPLLGAFHELSVAVGDVRAAVESCERLGFAQAITSDTFAHPYGVLGDGRLYLGLHQRRAPSRALTFVRPGIAACAAQLAAAGLPLAFCHAGEDVFNELGLTDPDGHAIAVLEARTYSPLAGAPVRPSLCGDFAAVGLPVRDFAAAQSFWEALGFVATGEEDSPWPHLALTSDQLDLSFHSPDVCARTVLLFRGSELTARREALAAAGIAPLSLPRGVDPAAGVMLAGPGDTALLLLAEPGEK